MGKKYKTRRANAAKGANTMQLKAHAATGYGNHGASRTKSSMAGFKPGGGSPERDIGKNLSELRTRARDLDAGGGIARSTTRTLTTNAIGYGLIPKPKIDTELLGMDAKQAEEWKRQVQREFRLWSESKNCDADRQRNFYELQELAFLSQLMSGDVFVTMPYIPRPQMPCDLRVRLIEADMIMTPGALHAVNSTAENGNKIENGVEIGDHGDVVAYYIAAKHPLGTERNMETTRVPAFGEKTGRPLVLHLMASERPGQRRGVPYIAPVIETLKQLDRYQLSELAANLVNSMYAIFIETQPGEDDDAYIPGEAQGSSAYEGYPGEGLRERGDIALVPGMVTYLEPGEKATTTTPPRNTAAFESFVKTHTMQATAALEQPKDVTLKDFNASYSASRASLLEFWKLVRKWRKRFEDNFCKVIYKEWMVEAVARGRIHAPGFFDDPVIQDAYCRCDWVGPSQGQIDPKKEIEAAALRVGLGVSTREREASEMNGTELEENIKQLRHEEELLGGLAGVTVHMDKSKEDKDE